MNPRLHEYESCALTNWATPPKLIYIYNDYYFISIGKMTRKLYNLISNKNFQITYKLIVFFTILLILYFKIDYGKLLSIINITTTSFSLIAFTFFILFIIIFFIYKRWVLLLSLNKNNKINKLKIFNVVLYGNLSSELSFLGIFISRAVLSVPEKIIFKDVIVTTLLEKILSAFFLFLICFPGTLLLIYRDKQIYEGFSLVLLILFFSSIIIFLSILIIFKLRSR